MVFAEDEEQVDKLLGPGRSRIHTVKHIIYSDPRGMRKYRGPAADGRQLHLIAMGHARCSKREPGPLRHACRCDGRQGRGRGGAVHHLGHHRRNPKLAMLSGRAACCATAPAYLSASTPRGRTDEYVSVLPLSWIMEQVYAVGMAMLLSRMKRQLRRRSPRR